MNKLATIYFGVIFLFLSCLPEPEPEPEPILNNCTIEVSIFNCPIFNCNNEIPLENQIVQLHSTIEEASTFQNPILVDSTNQNGWLKFYDLPCDQSFVLVADLGDYGIYLHEFNTFGFNQKLEVPLYKNYVYDHQPWPMPMVENVSLEYPAVGQVSYFKYFENAQEYSFDPTGHILSNFDLQLYINQQDNENTFYVVEYLNSSNNNNFTYFGNEYQYTQSIWRITEDTLFVSGFDSNYPIVSFLWNIIEDNPSSSVEYAIPLTSSSSEVLNLNGEFSNPDWEGVTNCSDYRFLDFTFQNILATYQSDEANGINKIQLYNKEFGLLSSLQISEGGPIKTAGFVIAKE